MMLEQDVTVENLNRVDLEYVLEHIREPDKRELEIMRFKDPFVLLDLEYVYCGKWQGEPVSVFGIKELDYNVQFFWFSTEVANQHWRKITKYGRGFISWINQKMFDKKLSVFVWEEHKQARLWLKVLGFQDTQYKLQMGPKLENVIFMEWKG